MIFSLKSNTPVAFCEMNLRSNSGYYLPISPINLKERINPLNRRSRKAFVIFRPKSAHYAVRTNQRHAR